LERPISNEKHAAALRARGDDAQRAIYEINLKRAAENHKRELKTSCSTAEHARNPEAAGSDARQRINTGIGHVGLMGSTNIC